MKKRSQYTLSRIDDSLCSKIFYFIPFSLTLKLIECSKLFQKILFFNCINYKISRIYEYCKKNDNYISKLNFICDNELTFLSNEEKREFVKLIITYKINNNEDIIFSFPKMENPLIDNLINDNSISNFILNINNEVEYDDIKTKFNNRLKGIKISRNCYDIIKRNIIDELISENKFLKIYDSIFEPDINQYFSLNIFLDSLHLKIFDEQINDFLYFFTKQNKYFFFKKLSLEFIENSKEIELNFEKFINLKEITLISENKLIAKIPKNILFNISKIFLKGCILKITKNSSNNNSKINELTYFIDSIDYYKNLIQILQIISTIHKSLTIKSNMIKYNGNCSNELIDEILSINKIIEFSFIDINKGNFFKLIKKKKIEKISSNIEKLLIDTNIDKNDNINDILLLFKDVKDFTIKIRNNGNSNVLINNDKIFILNEVPYSTKNIESINIICSEYMKINFDIFHFDQLKSISLQNCKFIEDSIPFFSQKLFKFSYIQKIELISTIENCSIFDNEILNNFYMNIKKMTNLRELKIQDSIINLDIIKNILINCSTLKKLNSLIIIKNEISEQNIYNNECFQKYSILNKIHSLNNVILFNK